MMARSVDYEDSERVVSGKKESSMDKVLLVNSIAHLLVDGVCTAALFGRMGSDPNLSMLVMLYTTLAFSTQGIVGILGDRLKTNVQADSIAMLIVAFGFLLPLPPLLRTVIIGFGNSIFHVAGGTMTLEDSNGKAGKLGIFVAPGAIGLNIGMLWPTTGATMAIALIISYVVLLFVCKDRTVAERNPTSHPRVAVIVLLTLSVAVRVIGGTVVQFPWNTTSGMAMLLALFVFAGKTAGGFVCDRVGVRATAMISLIPAAILIVFFSEWMFPSLMGQFLLNLTMPVTLWLLYRAMPDSPGFAFGLAASALWPGTLVGRMMNGQVLWVCVLISFSFGLIAILYSEKRILHGARRI